jgi:hypothetical protein
VLCCVVLCCVVLCCVVLCCVVLCCVVLCCVVLCCVVLCCIVLCRVVLCCVLQCRFMLYCYVSMYTLMMLLGAIPSVWRPSLSVANPRASVAWRICANPRMCASRRFSGSGPVGWLYHRAPPCLRAPTRSSQPLEASRSLGAHHPHPWRLPPPRRHSPPPPPSVAFFFKCNY